MSGISNSKVAPAPAPVTALFVVQQPHGHVRAVERTWTEPMAPCGGTCADMGVPVISKPFAIVCCILNFFLPGVGTIVAGFSWCCCPGVEGLTRKAKCRLCCRGYCCGFCQAAASGFVFGWVWSAVWGILFIVTSSKYYKKKEDRQVREAEGYILHV